MQKIHPRLYNAAFPEMVITDEVKPGTPRIDQIGIETGRPWSEHEAGGRVGAVNGWNGIP